MLLTVTFVVVVVVVVVVIIIIIIELIICDPFEKMFTDGYSFYSVI